MAAPDSDDSHVSNDYSSTLDPDFFISVYGGRKSDVEESLKKHLAPEEDAHLYQTWVNVSLIRRVGGIFSGSVESAGGITDLLFLLVVTVMIISLFIFWQLVVYVVVMIVLALLSGGAALKFLRGTFIELREERVDYGRLEDFVKEQVANGHFVHIKGEDSSKFLEYSRKATSATNLFKAGIYLSLLFATLILVVEVAYYFLNHRWLTDITSLLIFGISFILGVLLMDIGVVQRQLHDRSLR
ncbi:MAG: hypothetical protein ACFFEF_10755 [Candidatus Thorarchaeota archaeon]